MATDCVWRLPLGASLLVIMSVSLVGCSPKEGPSSQTLAQSPDDAATALSQLAAAPPPSSGESTIPPGYEAIATPTQATTGQANAGQPTMPQPSTPKPIALPLEQPGSASVDATGKPELQLPADLAPGQLVQFLAAADQDMQLIFTGRAGVNDPKQASRMLERLVRAKLEASRRLIVHASSTPQQKIDGQRGELQALSHLASGGELEAAQELERIASTGLQSDDPLLASDSRLVLIGFALEQLQNGKEDAPQKIVDLARQYSVSTGTPDVPALMILGQAREMLSSYGHSEEASAVRQVILDNFADANDPDLAEMAARLAGAVQLDQIERLQAAALKGEVVTPKQWSDAAQELVEQAKDLYTVRFLAGAALEFEGRGLQELAEATYAVLEQNFAGEDDALGREVDVAIRARESRESLLGAPIQLDLPSLEGETIVLSDYQGRIVLMPFWAAAFPPSLQLLPNIRDLQEQYPREIAVVGINLDSQSADLTKNAKEKLGFPNLHSVTDPAAAIPNKVAQQFGMVSMPFLVVLDRQQKVAAICFTEQQLTKAVQELIGPSGTP